MEYPKSILISTMKKLDLFDDVPYKYLKDIIDYDEVNIALKIEDLEDYDRIAWCKTRFTFELFYRSEDGIVTKEFVVEKEYNCSSPYSLIMIDLENAEDSEEESEEEEEEVCKDCDEQIDVDEDGAYLGSSFKCGECQDSFCADCRSFVGYTFGIMCCKCADKYEEED